MSSLLCSDCCGRYDDDCNTLFRHVIFFSFVETMFLFPLQFEIERIVSCPSCLLNVLVKCIWYVRDYNRRLDFCFVAYGNMRVTDRVYVCAKSCETFKMLAATSKARFAADRQQTT